MWVRVPPKEQIGIDGSKIPYSDFLKLFAKYAKEIENNDCEYTDWARKLMIENYNIKL